MKNKNVPIGVFDSGVGGLTVVREIMEQLPGEAILYFGDTARVPYGNKSEETVVRYSSQIIKFLLSKGAKTIVIACNTASAVALEKMKKEFEVPIIGVVEPGAKAAAKVTRNGRIGVIGTEATIRSGIYNEFLQKTNPHVTVYGKACPLFVPLAEEGWVEEDEITEQVARRYLAELSEQDIDTLVLGCTHYPLLRSVIQKVVGDKVQLVNPAVETARELKYLLEERRLLNECEKAGETYAVAGGTLLPQHEFFVSDRAEKFKQFAASILPSAILRPESVGVEKFE
ncbi:MAG: glutamate racemase [Lachnospiraceae bacterium]|nr:glutamate racemase [Lachnospiraceae bacterium]